jgi:hypothetical protein
LSGLWTKAPPKKQQAAGAQPAKAAGKGRAGTKAAVAPAADADAALKAAQEVRTTTAKALFSASESDHDARPVQIFALGFAAPLCRVSVAGRIVQVDSSDDDDDDFQPTQRGDTPETPLMLDADAETL